jgi:hypothetical protein
MAIVGEKQEFCGTNRRRYRRVTSWNKRVLAMPRSNQIDATLLIDLEPANNGEFS